MKILFLLTLIILSSCYESDTSACKQMCPLGVRVFEYKSLGSLKTPYCECNEVFILNKEAKGE